MAYSRALHRARRRHRARLMADQIRRGYAISQSDAVHIARLWSEQTPGVRKQTREMYFGVMGWCFEPPMLGHDPRVYDSLQYFRDVMYTLPPLPSRARR